jgi:hypothetical protein
MNNATTRDVRYGYFNKETIDENITKESDS